MRRVAAADARCGWAITFEIHRSVPAATRTDVRQGLAPGYQFELERLSRRGLTEVVAVDAKGRAGAGFTCGSSA